MNREFIKFCIVGASGVGVNYIFYKLSSLFIQNDIAWLFGIICATFTNYYLNKKWVFVD